MFYSLSVLLLFHAFDASYFTTVYKSVINVHKLDVFHLVMWTRPTFLRPETWVPKTRTNVLET